MNKKTSTSQEDYLETILMLINEKGACRVTDIANRLSYSKSSVSVAINKLEANGFVHRDDWRILLTPQGKKIAEAVYTKHTFFAQWFIQLGIDPSIAISEACQLEHAISDDTYQKIASYIKNYMDID